MMPEFMLINRCFVCVSSADGCGAGSSIEQIERSLQGANQCVSCRDRRTPIFRDTSVACMRNT